MNQSSDFLPFARPYIGSEEEAAVLEVLRSGWLTTGSVARAFEAEFAAFVEASAGMERAPLVALAVNSATSGLHLALEAIGVGPGDIVVTSPYTFTSSAAVARHLGAEIRFCDIGSADYNIDPARLEAIVAAEPRVRAVVPVHIGGLPCDMEAIMSICRPRGIAVVEDAAHAFPSRCATGMAGDLADVGVYSFYATKTITTGEGGMVVTRDRALAERMRAMRLHGFDREAWDRYTSRRAAWYYEVVEPGFKYNLPDLLAAVGRAQLGRADALLQDRRAMARAYDAALAGIEGIVPPPRHGGAAASDHAWHLYSIRVEPGAGDGGGRDSLVAWLSSAGIGSSVHFIPLHLMPYWSGRYALAPGDFPEAAAKYRSSLSLPIWPGMGGEAVGRVAQAVAAWAGAPTRAVS